MKTVILKGQEITIGSQVRFVDDRKLYLGFKDVIKPVVGQVYTVRGFTILNGFFLEEVKNVEINWINDQGELDDVAEPGFAAWRFEPAQPLRKKKIVRIEIFPQVEEILYIPEKKKSKEKARQEIIQHEKRIQSINR
jgi:hypothetical protein